jgi:hypothetical protein
MNNDLSDANRFCYACMPQALARRVGASRERARLREEGRYDDPWHLSDTVGAIARGEHTVTK